MNATVHTRHPGPDQTEFQPDFTGHVVGIIDDADVDLAEATAHLRAVGIPVADIHQYRGQRGLDAFDPTGLRHGLRARIKRHLENLIYEGQFEDFGRALGAGHAVVGVDVDDQHPHEVIRILREHATHDIVHFRRHTWIRYD